MILSRGYKDYESIPVAPIWAFICDYIYVYSVVKAEETRMTLIGGKSLGKVKEKMQAWLSVLFVIH